MYMYVCMYVCIYIYIEREICLSIYIYIYIYVGCPEIGGCRRNSRRALQSSTPESKAGKPSTWH